MTTDVFRTAKDIDCGEAALGTVQLTKHIAARQLGRPLLAYLESQRALAVPLGADLPVLYGRAAVLCSGRLPTPLRQKRLLVYHDVPQSIADRMTQLLTWLRCHANQSAVGLRRFACRLPALFRYCILASRLAADEPNAESCSTSAACCSLTPCSNPSSLMTRRCPFPRCARRLAYRLRRARSWDAPCSARSCTKTLPSCYAATRPTPFGTASPPAQRRAVTSS